MEKKYTLLFLLLFFTFYCSSQSFIGPGTNWNTAANWSPAVVPSTTISGTIIINSNVNVASIRVNNRASLIVNSPAILTVGSVGNSATTEVVDFQNGSTVNIKTGASLVVNGLLNNSNNSKGVTVDGSIAVNGNVTAGNGSTIVGGGTLETTGKITGAGRIFGTTANCYRTIRGNQTICSESTPSNITIASGNGTVQWQVSTDNISFQNILEATNTTLTGAQMGTLSTTHYYRAVVTSKACSAINSSVVTVRVIPMSVGGTVSGSATVCSGINSTVLKLTGHTGTVVRWESSLDNFATAGNAIENTSTTLTATNLNATTSYRAVLQSGACAEVPSASATITLETNTWKVILGVAQWQKGTPKDDQRIVFEANYNQNVNLQACSCEVKYGNVTIKDGKTLTLTNELKISGGSLTFENNASLIQINDVVNSGNITYKRETVTSIDKFDFTYWSSPVSGQTLYNTSPNTLSDKYMSFDAVTNDWFPENSITKVMKPGVGYSIRGPQNHYPPNPIGTYRANFIGVPNNGTIRVPITATDANYLLGNPYPSALDATAFLNGNAGVLDGTIYFWTHNTDIAPSGSLYMYSSDDYATYNLTGGTAVADSDPDKSPTNPHKPTGKIASGQGFFATGIAAGDVVFKNTMRVGVDGNTGDNTQFFRTKNTKSKIASTIEKNRVWLNLTNTKGAFKQILVGYVTGATNEYDSSYDGYSFSLNAYIDFYSFLGNDAMAIQGRALPFNDSDAVPLGYSSTIAGSFSISIDELDGTMQSQNVFLEDKMQNVVHNLKGSPYTFTTGIGTFDNRFVLRYTDKTLGNTDFERVNSSVVVSKDKNELKIKSEIETIKRVTVYDLLGKKVFEKEAVNSTEFRSSSIGFSQQIGIVKVTLDNGQVISKKVIF